MPSPDRMLAFAITSLLLLAIPGPSVLFTISRALAYGRKVALTSVIGGAAGSFTSAVAVAIGVGAIVQTSAAVYTAIKLVGAAYIIYLGVQAIRHRKRLRAAFEAQADALTGRRSWLQGFVVGATNPKSAMFFAAVLPQFVDPAAGNANLQMVVLGAIFAVLAVPSDALWATAAGAVRSWLARSARRLDLVGGAAGLTMVGLGIGLAVNGRKD